MSAGITSAGVTSAGVTSAGLAGRVARGGVAALVIHVGGAGLTYGAQLLIARTVGADGFGIYAYVFAWMTVLAYGAALGFDVAMLRFVPAYRTQEAWSLLRGVIRFAERTVAALGCGFVLLGSLAIWGWGSALPDGLATTILIGLWLVPVWALLWVRSSVVRAFGGVWSALAPDRIVRDGLLLGIVAFAHGALGWSLGAPWVMAATLASAAAGLGLVSLAMHRRLPGAARCGVPSYATGAWVRAALPLAMVGVAEVAMNRTGTVLLGWFGQTTEAGIYALAFNIAFLTALPRAAVNTLLAPAISDLFIRGDRDALQALATRSALWTLLGAACIAAPVAVLAEPILGWFGRDFAAGAPVLRILLLAQVIVAGTGSQLYLLTMTGHERSAALLMGCGTAGNAVLGAACIGLFGLTGIAVAAATTLIVVNTAMAVLVWRSLGLLPGTIAAVRPQARRRLRPTAF